MSKALKIETSTPCYSINFSKKRMSIVLTKINELSDPRNKI